MKKKSTWRMEETSKLIVVEVPLSHLKERYGDASSHSLQRLAQFLTDSEELSTWEVDSKTAKKIKKFFALSHLKLPDCH